MKIIIVHGDNTVKAYERLSVFIKEAKKRNWEVTDYSFSAVANQTLFDSEKFYILKDYKKINKSEILKLDKYSGNLIIYHEGKIPATAIKTFKPSKIESFDLPQKIWGFLDNITIKGLHEVIETEAPELVFALLSSRLKDLYWVTVGIPNYPSWRVSKLKSQASKYSISILENVINKLSEIDIKVKTSNVKLIDLLDLLIIKHLQ